MRPKRFMWLALAVVLAASCEAGQDAGDEASEPGSRGEPGQGAGAQGSLDPQPQIAQETATQFMARTEGEGRDDAVPGAVAVRAACANCHGPEAGGKPVLGTPMIAGLEPWYIARQLAYFKQGIRGHTDEDVYGRYMRGIALTLEDDRVIEDLAYHFASLDAEPTPDRVEGDVERGAELYAACAACHGEDGRGNSELDTPTMIGQSGTYLVRQLEHYRQGIRGSQPQDTFGMQMVPVVENGLADTQDSVDVVAYIQTLPEGAAEVPAAPDVP